MSKKNAPLALPPGASPYQLTAQELVAEAHRIRAARLSDDGSPPRSEDEDVVLDALLLAGGSRGAGGLSQWLQAGGHAMSAGRPFRAADVTLCLQALQRRALIEAVPGRGYLADLALHAERLQALLLRPEARGYWRRLAWMFGGGHGEVDRPLSWLGLRSADEKVALLRLFVHAGLQRAVFEQQLTATLSELDDPLLLRAALTEPWMPQAVAAMETDLRSHLLGQVLDLLPTADPRATLMREWLQQRFQAAPQTLAPDLRARMAEACVQALDFEGMRRLLAGLHGPSLSLFEAAELAYQGQWPQAVVLFE